MVCLELPRRPAPALGNPARAPHVRAAGRSAQAPGEQVFSGWRAARGEAAQRAHCPGCAKETAAAEALRRGAGCNTPHRTWAQEAMTEQRRDAYRRLHLRSQARGRAAFAPPPAAGGGHGRQGPKRGVALCVAPGAPFLRPALHPKPSSSWAARAHGQPAQLDGRSAGPVSPVPSPGSTVPPR